MPICYFSLFLFPFLLGFLLPLLYTYSACPASEGASKKIPPFKGGILAPWAMLLGYEEYPPLTPHGGEI